MRVLNAGGHRHLATRLTVQLRQLGFTIAAPPANDPDCPQGSLDCVGAIVFGPNGESAARTISLAAPCTHLVRDDRQTGSVGLILGTYFTQIEPDSAALHVLPALNGSPVVPAGGLQSCATDLQTVHARQHQVQQDHIEGW